jgi:hypothetical protein
MSVIGVVPSAAEVVGVTPDAAGGMTGISSGVGTLVGSTTEFGSATGPDTGDDPDIGSSALAPMPIALGISGAIGGTGVVFVTADAVMSGTVIGCDVILRGVVGVVALGSGIICPAKALSSPLLTGVGVTGVVLALRLFWSIITSFIQKYHIHTCMYGQLRLR